VKVIVPGFESAQYRARDIESDTCSNNLWVLGDYSQQFFPNLYLVEEELEVLQQSCPDKIYNGPPCG